MKNNNELLSSLKLTLMTLMVLKVKQGDNMDYGWNTAVEREEKKYNQPSFTDNITFIT